MKMTEGIMGMSVAVEVLDDASGNDLDEVLDYFHKVDALYSTYKKTSEISRLNAKQLSEEDLSLEVKKVLRLSEETRQLTNGYFDIHVEGIIDPSGLVKGYAIWEASKMLSEKGYKNFYIEIGGDIDIRGTKNGLPWKVGIRNPLDKSGTTGVLKLTDCGVATSGTYERGMHIYDPIKKRLAPGILSLTVIGPNIYEADRFATACYAMGEKGIDFLEKRDGLEGLMITKDGKTLITSGFRAYLV
jgi:thiamine biosynthesis lipoprotein